MDGYAFALPTLQYCVQCHSLEGEFFLARDFPTPALRLRVGWQEPIDTWSTTLILWFRAGMRNDRATKKRLEVRQKGRHGAGKRAGTGQAKGQARGPAPTMMERHHVEN